MQLFIHTYIICEVIKCIVLLYSYQAIAALFCYLPTF